MNSSDLRLVHLTLLPTTLLYVDCGRCDFCLVQMITITSTNIWFWEHCSRQKYTTRYKIIL